MHVEDHPVSYFDFEGNHSGGQLRRGHSHGVGRGHVAAASPVPVNGKYVPGTEAEAARMIAKGDLKFRLQGKRLKGDFFFGGGRGGAGADQMRGRRPGSKGNEWLMIKNSTTIMWSRAMTSRALKIRC